MSKNAGVKDQRVQTAIAHWAARFISNGVPYADFIEVTANISVWEQWCSAWSARGKIHEDLGKKALQDGYGLSASQHFTTAGVCYHFGKFLFVDDMAQMKAAHERAIYCRNQAMPHLRPPGVRVEIPFDGSILAGNLRRPEGIKHPPLVIMLMGLDSAKEEMDEYEKSFLARGLATLSIEGPGQGEAEYDLALRPDFEVPIVHVFDWVVHNGDIDADRIGLWGVSFGGYHAPRVAAFEKRVKACVALSGPFDFGAVWEQFPELSREAFRVRTKTANLEDAAVMANRFSLEPVAHAITCPIYIVTGDCDRVISWENTAALAKAVSGPVICDIIEGASHVANNRGYRYRPQTADWMARQLYN
jgi:dienelactone hydrolase